MIFHVSIDADRPQHVAEVIAELWGGAATPFPPVATGSWVAFAGDARNSVIEVYPRGTELVPGEGDADAVGSAGLPKPGTATHIAIATRLQLAQVEAIAAREGWCAKYRKRGGVFGVIEFWIENRVMIEVLTEPMQHEYLDGMTVAGWRAMLAGMERAREPALA